VIEARGLIEVSIGDYALSDSEIAAVSVLAACVRLIPGVMGKEESGADESFESGCLNIRTSPAPRMGKPSIPDVLLSGDHAKIAAWRSAEAERITRQRRRT
jgi:tRNA (guanine37-N1)-methyltransferase